MIIRNAISADFAAIDEIIKAAFAASPLGHNGEVQLVRSLHDDGDVVVSLVAEQDGQLVGHVLFSRMVVEADAIELKGAGLAPVSVIPDVQGRGVGSALINAGLDQLIFKGMQISFVLGNAEYYPRFGYSPALAAPYVSPFAGAHFMAVHLDTTLALPQRGKADYAPAFA
jgi:putative acetyltransferase